MNKFIPKGPYHYRRSSDGCDETFEVVSRSTGQHVVAVRFWEKEEEANATAQWITASVNLAHAVTELMAVQEDDTSSTTSDTGRQSVPNPTMRRDRADRFAKHLEGSEWPLASFIELLTDALHWCDREFIDFDDALVHATGTFHSETKA